MHPYYSTDVLHAAQISIYNHNFLVFTKEPANFDYLHTYGYLTWYMAPKIHQDVSKFSFSCGTGMHKYM